MEPGPREKPKKEESPEMKALRMSVHGLPLG